MAEKKGEIKKPSLTQRKFSSGPEKSKTKTTSKADKLDKSPLKKNMTSKSEEEISIFRVVIVIISVIFLAALAAFLIIRLQDGDNEEINDDQNQEDVSDVSDETDVTDTEEPVEPTLEATEEPSDSETDEDQSNNSDQQEIDEQESQSDAETDQDPSFTGDTQTVPSSVSGNDIRIRTFQYSNDPQSGIYTFSLLSEAIDGDSDIPNASANFNDAGNVVLRVENVGEFVSCSFINNESTSFAFENVTSITCNSLGDGVYEFTLALISETGFELSEGTATIESTGEEVSSIDLRIQND